MKKKELSTGMGNISLLDFHLTERGYFSADQAQIEGTFFFEQDGTIQVKPSGNMKGILVFGEISFGIVPSPPLEDLIYAPKDDPSSTKLNLPSENLFVGLLKGEDRLLFCAWPPGDQKVKLLLEEQDTQHAIRNQQSFRLSGLGPSRYSLMERVHILDQLLLLGFGTNRNYSPRIWRKM